LCAGNRDPAKLIRLNKPKRPEQSRAKRPSPDSYHLSQQLYTPIKTCAPTLYAPAKDVNFVSFQLSGDTVRPIKVSTKPVSQSRSAPIQVSVPVTDMVRDDLRPALRRVLSADDFDEVAVGIYFSKHRISAKKNGLHLRFDVGFGG